MEEAERFYIHHKYFCKPDHPIPVVDYVKSFLRPLSDHVVCGRDSYLGHRKFYVVWLAFQSAEGSRSNCSQPDDELVQFWGGVVYAGIVGTADGMAGFDFDSHLYYLNTSMGKFVTFHATPYYNQRLCC